MAISPLLSVRFAVSPYGLSLISLGMLVLSIVIPPAIYEAYILEPDLIWSTPFMPVFFVLCVLCFLAGVSIVETLCEGSQASRRKSLKMACYRVETVIWVLGLAILLNLISGALIIRGSAGMLSSFLSLNGALVKSALADNSGNMLLSAQPILRAVTVWAVFRYFQYRADWTRRDAKLVRNGIIGSIVTLVLMSVITLSRFNLVPTMIELGVVYVYCLPPDRSGGTLKLVLNGLVLGVLVIGVFLLFSYIRGNDNGTLLISAMMGYGLSNFNHLCAELRGNFLLFAGRGNYTIPFVTTLPLVHRIVDIGAVFGLQDMDTIFRSQFIATSYVGLNGILIWVTAFGYYYADLGNYVYIYVFATGLLTGACWRGFQTGNTFGIVMYAQAASSIALWFTYNIFVQAALMIYLSVGVGIYLVERYFNEWSLEYPSGISPEEHSA